MNRYIMPILETAEIEIDCDNKNHRDSLYERVQETIRNNEEKITNIKTVMKHESTKLMIYMTLEKVNISTCVDELWSKKRELMILIDEMGIQCKSRDVYEVIDTKKNILRDVRGIGTINDLIREYSTLVSECRGQIYETQTAGVEANKKIKRIVKIKQMTDRLVELVEAMKQLLGVKEGVGIYRIYLNRYYNEGRSIINRMKAISKQIGDHDSKGKCIIIRSEDKIKIKYKPIEVETNKKDVQKLEATNMRDMKPQSFKDVEAIYKKYQWMITQLDVEQNELIYNNRDVTEGHIEVRRHIIGEIIKMYNKDTEDIRTRRSSQKYRFEQKQILYWYNRIERLRTHIRQREYI